ncbi:MAG: amino acid adenylation domain-containing protein [Lachnospiraceae bacterium]|nr:amino acid adenylation domain-containing protein [Lachnospiraceae bacterium]
MSIFLDCQIPGKETAYNNVFGFFLPNDMKPDPEKLRSIVREIVGRYPILTSLTRIIDGIPSLVPQIDAEIDIKLIDAVTRDHSVLAKSINTPFDLENDIPCRAVIYRMEDGLYLLLCAHHIVCDGTSLSLLAKNIAEAYNGEKSDPEEMSNLSLALYEAEHDKEQTKDDLVYRNMLENLEGDTSLYADDDPNLKSQEGKLGVFNTTLYKSRRELSGYLHNVLLKNHITESSLFMSAYAYMLRILCNQKNVLFFVGENGRHDPILKNTIGMMVHNIPVLSNIDDEQKCISFMSDLQEHFHNLVAHDGADFSGLYGEFGIHPDCFFVYQGDMLSDVKIDGRLIPMELFHSDDVMASLTLHVLKRSDADYELVFEYDCGKFLEDTIERMARLYTMIVDGLCGKAMLKDIKLIDDENEKELEVFNMTDADVQDMDIVSMFKETVRKYPENKAVVYKQWTLTYTEVDAISDSIAGKLMSMGIGKGDVVSILIPRSSWMTLVPLGVLKSGAAYQPLDPTYPSERLTFMMNDVSSKLLIAEEGLISRVPEASCPVLFTKDIMALPKCDAPLHHPSPSDLFILLYTSGSTGVPKGVMLEHRNIVNFCSCYKNLFNLDESSRVAAYASFGFDANMMDQYPALISGACIYIVEEEIRLDLKAMEAWFNFHGITHAFMTTQVGRQFYSMASPEKLKYLLVGGEKLVPLPPKPGNPQLINLYGPTECTIAATCCNVDRLYTRVPIGKSLSNYKCYVVDEYLRRLPPLVPGELMIAGRGVGRGYLNRSELNEKAFICNPFCAEKSYDRVYRTGDIVRFLPDGRIDFIGRSDGQVKVRGFRIELTEVEQVIREFVGIQDATVQAFEDKSTGEKYIAAYIVSAEVVDISAMNEFIMERKPPYMVPSVTMQIDKIPLNQNQKVNKKALPVPQRKKEEIVPPTNDVQKKIYDCVADVLGHKDFGITTNLYYAGLSSIGAMSLIAKLSGEFNAVVTYRDLKEYDTIDKLETFLTGDKAKLETFDVQSEYGLTRTQEGIYVECIARPDDTVYNIPLLLEISDQIDTARLKSAIITAINAHPILKVRLFLTDDGEARMRRMDGDESFDEQAIEERSIDSIEAEKARLVKPFKLIGGRLFRVRILRGEKLWLFIEMHHIICDGSSIGIFLRDISLAYAGKVLQRETYTGFEVVLNEEKARNGNQYTTAKKYYEDLLNDAETQSLPAGDLSGTEKSGTDVYERAALGLSADEVKKWCEENKTSLNGLFSSAFGLTLNKYLGTDSSVFAGIYNGRNDSRVSGTMAMLVKTLPIVTSVNKDKTIAQFVQDISKQLVDSQSNDIYSFAEISRSLHVNADVMFAWQGDEFLFDSFCDLPCKIEPLHLSEAKAPLNLNVYMKENSILFSMEYRSDRYSENYIRCFIDSLEEALKGLLHQEWLSEVSILSDEAFAKLSAFNNTCEEGSFPCAPELFAMSSEHNADKKAVIACGGDNSLTFRELWNRAGAVAEVLIRDGVQPDDRVALYMDRTEDVYVVREGILLSGAAFVSLELEYPDDRIRYIMQDAGIRKLITTRELIEGRDETFTVNGKKPEIIFLEDMEINKEFSFTPPVSIDPDSIAYCIYTSGSTGKPKGVEILHRNLANLLHYGEKNTLAKAYVDNSTNFLALAAITFDVSVIEEMMPLYHGRTVTLATQEEIHNPLLLMRTVQKTGVDMMKCTPSYLQSILDVDEAAKALKGLRALIVGAEPFPKAMYTRIREAGFEGNLFNSYGPTETCVSVSIGELDGRRVTIGGPTLNTVFLIRDQFGNLLPPYAKGELIIAGEQVGKGYVNLPEMNSEKFIDINWNERKIHAYKSGDIAYFDGHGEIIHCGRNDNQVKLRGLRIELDGIENVMNSYPGIKRSVVLVKGEDDKQFLCGYYTSNEPVDEAALTAHMKETLTAYMIPAVFVHLGEFPMTVNGKINKRALPEPDFKTKKRSNKAPSTDLQKKIAKMFAKALNVESVAIDEDFFEIGGTSILASTVAMQAMVAGLPIAYQDIFANPTVEALEQNILSKQQTGDNKDDQKKDAPISVVFPDREPEIKDVLPALQHNTMKYIDEICSVPLGNILLTGATGFLGIHVLKELLESDCGKITCFVRRGNSETAQKRLESMLVYYFEDNYRNAFASGKLKAIDGDLTDRELVLSQSGVSFDVVINCAACVKHFANDDILTRVNVKGVENLIALCEKTGSRLIQISTVSVAGENVNYKLPDSLILRENMLYFGQDLSNQYVRSKFDAEKAILSAISAGKLRGKIVRVGNLMSRDSDGEFQVNSITNGFMRNLKGYAAIGAFPVSMMARPVEFSPIDKVAQAVCLLAGTPDTFTVFHAVNGHSIEMGDVVVAMNTAGIPVDVVSDAEIKGRMAVAMQDESRSMLVSGLISYLSSDADIVRTYVGEDHTFSKNALYHLGYHWPLTDKKYLMSAIEALKSMDFFNGNEKF